ncbi:MAG: hypothetical protein COV74_00845, partial [Candidatus Omnitrophica bacterium CG11_big_fil_rev_8_21_14_0_20_45_26]
MSHAREYGVQSNNGCLSLKYGQIIEKIYVSRSILFTLSFSLFFLFSQSPFSLAAEHSDKETIVVQMSSSVIPTPQDYHVPNPVPEQDKVLSDRGDGGGLEDDKNGGDGGAGGGGGQFGGRFNFHVSLCGNGKIEGNEECDDSNRLNGDGCSNICLSEKSICGNGWQEAGEDCGEPNLPVCPSDHVCINCKCQSDQLVQCGNGVLDPGEECFDGNTLCRSPFICNEAACLCVAPGCGNGVLEKGEVCGEPGLESCPLGKQCQACHCQGACEPVDCKLGDIQDPDTCECIPDPKQDCRSYESPSEFCDDQNACTQDACDSQTGRCRHISTADCHACETNDDCEDESFCNGTEYCEGGVCQSPSAPPCGKGICDETNNQCWQPCQSSDDCQDGNACNGKEVCLETGYCGPGKAMDCDDQNACTTDLCNEIKGCEHIETTDCKICKSDQDCDDGIFCNGQETCDQGVCQSSQDSICQNSQCDEDAKRCWFACQSDEDCDDQNPCNGIEICQDNHLCGSGESFVCDDHKPCTKDQCDPALGCIYTPQPNCQSCAQDNDCDDKDSCTTDLCDPKTGCTHESIPGCQSCQTDSECGDGNWCNGQETCGADGYCVNGEPVTCQADNACSTAICNPDTGQCSQTVDPNCKSCQKNGDCDDGIFCNGQETCSGGICHGSSDPCAGGACDENSKRCWGRCESDEECTDNDACNGQEACQADGFCGPGTPVICKDSNLCTKGACDLETGLCHYEADPSCRICQTDRDCSDGIFCNGTEVCRDGICQPSETLPCPGGVCDETLAQCWGRCSLNDDCDDDNPCNGKEVCQEGGVCGPGELVECDDGNSCTKDSCDPVTANCLHETDPACQPCEQASECDDDVFCNGQETCAGGICRRSAISPCEPNEVCDEIVKECRSDCGAVGCPDAERCEVPYCKAEENGIQYCQWQDPQLIDPKNLDPKEEYAKGTIVIDECCTQLSYTAYVQYDPCSGQPALDTIEVETTQTPMTGPGCYCPIEELTAGGERILIGPQGQSTGCGEAVDTKKSPTVQVNRSRGIVKLQVTCWNCCQTPLQTSRSIPRPSDKKPVSCGDVK